MFTEYKHTLRRMRGQIIGWAVSVFLYDALMSSFYTTVQEMGDQFNELLQLYPPEMLAFFPEMLDIASPIGYLDTYFFAFMSLIMAFFTINAGAKLLVGHEEQGVLDLLMSYPISRAKLFWGRVLGLVTATVLVMAAAWVGWVTFSETSGLGFTASELLTAMLPLTAMMLLFAALSLFLSMVLPSGRITNGIVSGVLIANYLLDGMSNINEDLRPLYEISPMYFTQGARAIEEFNTEHFYGLLVASLVFFVLAWLLFERRDIRVAGEGGWQLPDWLRFGAKAK